jgi:hypothetical protein
MNHSPLIHAKNRNLAFKTDVIAADEYRRNGTVRPFKGDGPEMAKRSSKIEGRCAMTNTMTNNKTRMTKTLTALAAAATLTIAAVAAPQPAEARGGRIAAGIIGGLAAGAIIGGIASNSYGYYGPGYYGYGPGYYGYGPGPVYYGGPDCYWTRQRIWDGWNWHLRRVRVCD